MNATDRTAKDLYDRGIIEKLEPTVTTDAYGRPAVFDNESCLIHHDCKIMDFDNCEGRVMYIRETGMLVVIWDDGPSEPELVNPNRVIRISE